METKTAKEIIDEVDLNEMWVDKYKPIVSADLVGNKDNLEEIKEWFEKYKNKDPNIKRALLIVGPPGTGKTTSSKVIAEEAGYRVMEFNASDCRNKKSIQNCNEDGMAY